MDGGGKGDRVVTVDDGRWPGAIHCNLSQRDYVRQEGN